MEWAAAERAPSFAGCAHLLRELDLLLLLLEKSREQPLLGDACTREARRGHGPSGRQSSGSEGRVGCEGV